MISTPGRVARVGDRVGREGNAGANELEVGTAILWRMMLVCELLLHSVVL